MIIWVESLLRPLPGNGIFKVNSVYMNNKDVYQTVQLCRLTLAFSVHR